MFKGINLEDGSNIYMIVKEEELTNGSFKKLPFRVFCFLRVTGKDYYTSNIS